MYRQGDLLFIEVKGVDKQAKLSSDRVIAYGEVTGHAHTLEAGEVYKQWDTEYLVIPANGSRVVHQEHDPITLPEGVFMVRHQREYISPDEEARVRD